MAKKEIKQTYSSFSRNAEVNRANEIRRDNDVIKTPKCTIEDVDWAIMSYIQDVIKADFAEAGDEDVYRKLYGDLKDKNISEDQIRKKMQECNEKATTEVS